MVANLYRWDDKVTQAEPPTHLLGHDNDAWNEWKCAVEGQLFLFGEDFSHLDLSGANLEYMAFNECDFFKTKCVGADFSYSTFCSFSELGGVNFRGANLNYTQFWQCRIVDVNFNKTTMRNTNFFECEFDGECTFKGVNLSTAKGIDHFDVVSSTIIEGEAYAAYRNPKNGKVRIWTSSGPIDSLSDLDAPFRDQLHYWFDMVKVKFKCESYDLVIST